MRLSVSAAGAAAGACSGASTCVALLRPCTSHRAFSGWLTLTSKPLRRKKRLTFSLAAALSTRTSSSCGRPCSRASRVRITGWGQARPRQSRVFIHILLTVSFRHHAGGASMPDAAGRVERGAAPAGCHAFGRHDWLMLPDGGRQGRTSRKWRASFSDVFVGRSFPGLLWGRAGQAGNVAGAGEKEKFFPAPASGHAVGEALPTAGKAVGWLTR